MDSHYVRLKLYWFFLGPISKRAREGRMKLFYKIAGLKEGMSVLDLGGRPQFWDPVPIPLDLTILNLPGAVEQKTSATHKLRCVEGDACAVDGMADRSFDIVFSNSVIEHVGSAERRAGFAHEARRLGKSYWIQTPAIWFPIEAHSGMPFWFFYPERLRRYFLDRWRKKLQGNAWVDMVETTTVLSRRELERLFPEATIVLERAFGIPKSYLVYFVPNS
jgi:Methyltransferase domain